MVCPVWLYAARANVSVAAVSEDIALARDVLAALKLMGLLERLPIDQERKGKEGQAGGPEMMWLRAAYMLAGFRGANFLSRSATADVPAERHLVASELMFTGSAFPEEVGGEVAMLYAMAARLEDTLRCCPQKHCGTAPRSVPRLVLQAMQAAGLVAELLSVAGEEGDDGGLDMALHTRLGQPAAACAKPCDGRPPAAAPPSAPWLCSPGADRASALTAVKLVDAHSMSI